MKKTLTEHYTEAEVAEFVRLRQERRMPGNARLRAQREVGLFKAAVQQAKRRKRKQPRGDN